MADAITLHVPATPETHQLIADDQFASMKEGVVIITGFGRIVLNFLIYF